MLFLSMAVKKGLCWVEGIAMDRLKTADSAMNADGDESCEHGVAGAVGPWASWYS